MKYIKNRVKWGMRGKMGMKDRDENKEKSGVGKEILSFGEILK